MERESSPEVQLATFDQDVASAVVTVLLRSGVRAGTASLPGVPDGEVAVLVDAADRERALALLAERIEEVAAELREAGGARVTVVTDSRPSLGASEDDDEGHGRPLVMERFRNMGFVAMVLAPLLIITLSARSMSLTWALIVFIGGMVALTAWRNRS